MVWEGPQETQALLDECADWVAEQLEEENMLVDPGLIALIMEVERALGPLRAASQELATSIEAALLDRGVQGVPDAINALLIFNILQWEDEFMGLAGRPRLP